MFALFPPLADCFFFSLVNRKKIASVAFGTSKSDVQCLHRWQKVLDPTLVKGPWKSEEDELIQKLVGQFGPKKWR